MQLCMCTRNSHVRKRELKLGEQGRMRFSFNLKFSNDYRVVSQRVKKHVESILILTRPNVNANAWTTPQWDRWDMVACQNATKFARSTHILIRKTVFVCAIVVLCHTKLLISKTFPITVSSEKVFLRWTRLFNQFEIGCRPTCTTQCPIFSFLDPYKCKCVCLPGYITSRLSTSLRCF